MAYNASLCGCYYYVTHVVTYQPRVKQYLPLLDSEAHSTILSTTSRTVLRQTFTNPFPQKAIHECIYNFPLYDGASVVGFTCTIGSRVLTGLVKENAKAKDLFNEAVAKGETAGLLQQVPEVSDVLSTRLGNIPAGESVIVEITYIGELKHHGIEGIRFTIPTSIAPRYGKSSFDALAGRGFAKQDGGIKITVDVNMPEGSFIKGVQSPSHPIAVSMGTISTAVNADPVMSKASATLSLGVAALEKDFVLIVQSKDIGVPKAILETHPTILNHRALMATLVPKFSLPQSRPEVVFVADRSGSMRSNMKMLTSAMKVFLQSMPVGVKFNICSFGAYHSFLWPQSKSYTNETLQLATSHVESFDARMGGTETFSAIKATVDRRLTDLPLEIILLTDGDICQQEELFTYINEQVKDADGKIRVFPLGIGNGVSSSLIEGLARAGNGFSQLVQQGERLDNSVVRMLRGALTPHITDYTLEVRYEKDDDDFELIDKVTDGIKVLLSDTAQPRPEKPKPTISLFDVNADPEKEDIKSTDVQFLPKIPHPKILQAPQKIPSLFAFSRTSVYLLMSPETVQRNPTTVVLRATSAHGPLALEIPIEALSAPGETIHQLAAKKAVQDLEEGRGWIFDAQDQAGVFIKNQYPSRFEDLIQREAVRLGEQFQVASRWCSFVAVAANDVQIIVKREQQPQQKIQQPSLPLFRSARRGMVVATAQPRQREEYKTGGSETGEYEAAEYGAGEYKTGGYGTVMYGGSVYKTGGFGTGDYKKEKEKKVKYRKEMEKKEKDKKERDKKEKDKTRKDRTGGSELVRRMCKSPAPKSSPLASPMEQEPSKKILATGSMIDKVLALIALQDFEGYWPENNVQVSAIMGLGAPKYPEGVDHKVWITLLVIAFLEVNCASEEGTWGLVAEKARAWLADNVTTGLEDAEKQALESLKN